MFGVTDYGAFVVAFIVLLMIPGPGNLALILSTGKGGIRGGIASTFGVIFGDQVLLWLAVAGVAALLKANPAAFHLVQWIGAAYLVYLGLRMIFAKPGQGSSINIEARRYLWQTLLITVFNPKAIIFYMAFFPLFIDPQTHQGMLTFGFMAVTIMLLTLIYGLIVVLLTYFLAERLRANPTVSRWLERLAGMCLVGFGVKLTLQ